VSQIRCYDPRGHCCSLFKFVGLNRCVTCRRVFTVDCYAGDGRYYGGAVNVTDGGLACQRWADQYPHRHTFRPDLAPLLDNAGNACRNAGGVYQRPWCYTVDPNVRWQYCDVAICGQYICRQYVSTRGSTMTATNHDDQLGEIYPTMLNELKCTIGVSFSRFHCCDRHGYGLWPSWYWPDR